MQSYLRGSWRFTGNAPGNHLCIGVGAGDTAGTQPGDGNPRKGEAKAGSALLQRARTSESSRGLSARAAERVKMSLHPRGQSLSCLGPEGRCEPGASSTQGALQGKTGSTVSDPSFFLFFPVSYIVSLKELSKEEVCFSEVM